MHQTGRRRSVIDIEPAARADSHRGPGTHPAGRLILPLLVGLGLAGCFKFDGQVCTAVFVYGVGATLIDDQGDPVTGATLTLADGDFSETMDELRPGEYVGAGERPGTYTLTVEAPGFATVTIEDLIVDADECHVIPISREIILIAG